MAQTPEPLERPSQRRSFIRSAVVWDQLRTLLDQAPHGSQRVVDIGGGTGGFAVRIAELGHHVTVIDPSPDALAAANRRAQERGVADHVLGIQGDLGDLERHGLADVDLVLCHDVFGVVDDHTAALASISGVLRSGGALSLLVRQRHAAVLTRAMAGHFQQAHDLLDNPAVDREHRFTADELRALLADSGYQLDTLQGVRVFADLVPSSLIDIEPGASTALVELERAVAERPEFLAVATQMHAVAHPA